MFLRGFWAIIILPVFAFCCYDLSAQSLPEQDCIGAIPLCQTTYSTTIAYSGSGNIPNEINPAKSCLSSGEKNDAWYIFTAQTTGNVGFLITPFNGQDDYDWAVFNLTNKQCHQIFNDTSMEVSCNYDANVGCGGITGPNGTISPCGQTEQLIPVIAGETYVVNVSNYSSSQNGYTIDFGSSTALIYDNLPPQKINTTVTCTSKSVTLQFNEPIDCRTIANNGSDLVIADENGQYKSIQSLAGSGCTNSSYYTSSVVVAFDEMLSNSSEYYLIAKTGTDGNTLSDKCNNFFQPGDTIAVILTQNNLSVNLGADVSFCANDINKPTLQLPLSNDATYSWSLNGQILNHSQYQLTIDSVGIYSGKISYGSVCSTSDTVLTNHYPTLSVFAGNDTTVCSGQSFPALSSNIQDATYLWALNGLPVSTSVSFLPMQAGVYTLTVNKPAFCSGIDTVILSRITLPQLDLGNNIGICNTDTIEIASPHQYNFYQWVLNGVVISTDSILRNITQAGDYVLSAGINSTCFDIDSVLVFAKTLTPVSLGNDIVSCIYDSLPEISAISTASHFTWYFNDSLINFNTNSIQSVGVGNYIVVAQSNNYCLNSDTISVTQSDVLPVNFGEDKVVCETDHVQLNSGINSLGVYEWRLNNFPVAAHSSSIEVSQTGEYIFEFTGNSGCTATDTVFIDIRKQLNAPLVNCPQIINGKKLFTWSEIRGAPGYWISENLGINWSLNTFASQREYETTININQLWVKAEGDSVCPVGKIGVSTSCEVFVPSVFISSSQNLFTIEGAETPLQILITDAMGRSILFEGDYKNNFSLTSLSSGLYLYKIKSGKAKYQTGRFLLIK